MNEVRYVKVAVINDLQYANVNMQMLENMYKKYSGDLDEIFDELGEDPGKAKKYPPENAKVFARKYREGFYSYIKDENRAEAK